MALHAPETFLSVRIRKVPLDDRLLLRAAIQFMRRRAVASGPQIWKTGRRGLRCFVLTPRATGGSGSARRLCQRFYANTTAPEVGTSQFVLIGRRAGVS